MDWQFWRRVGPKKLPGGVQREIVRQFRMDPDRVATLRYLDRQGTFAGRPVREIRVFDPALAPRRLEEIKHFEQIEGQPCVLFEGWLERDGIPVLNDARQAAAAR